MSAPTYNPITQTIRAKCAYCEGALSVFQYTNQIYSLNQVHQHGTATYQAIRYIIFRCTGCGRGALGILHDHGSFPDPNPGNCLLEAFYPFAAANLPVPPATPADVQAEFREAELCAAAGANRAASALFRSTLEKTLKANGYTKENSPTLKDLQKRIDAAAADGIITDARRKRAHDDIRSLGNDVLHDDWRPVDAAEVEAAHHYTQRILEDFYDDRSSVEAILVTKKRISAPATPAPTGS